MSEEPETNENIVSDSNYRGEELANVVQGAIDDWVSDEDAPVWRDEDKVVADEKELVKNISLMMAIAADEAKR